LYFVFVVFIRVSIVKLQPYWQNKFQNGRLLLKFVIYILFNIMYWILF
jgi:hypothetical protein